MLRFAVPEDAETLLAIYAPYIDTSITFEYELPSAAEFRRRIEDFSAEYPYLVHETDGVADGYAYAHRFAPRAAYQWSAELSVYIAPEARGRGLGKALYTALIALLRLQGVRTVYALVTQPNEASDRFHRAMGFAAAGVTHNVGYKAGQWRGVTYYEKAIAPYDDAPQPLQSIRNVDPAEIKKILS